MLIKSDIDKGKQSIELNGEITGFFIFQPGINLWFSLFMPNETGDEG